MSFAENVEATVPLALHALTTHLVDHQLPAPRDLNLRPEDRCIQLYIFPEHLDAWLDSGFQTDTKTTTPIVALSATGTKWERVDINGTIPAPVGDIAIRLSWPQRSAEPHLKAVQA